MRRPLLYALTGFVAICCVGLGIWQLQRLHDRRALNNELIHRTKLPLVALGHLELSGGRSDPYAYRRVRATGTYDVTREVILRARAIGDRPGNHVLDPLRLSDGTGIIIDRGWVPLDHDRPDGADFKAPSKQVTITGILVPTEPKPILFGPTDPSRGVLSTIGRIDLPRLQKQIPYSIKPLYLVMEEQQPPQSGVLPTVEGLPPPGEGPHFSYAIQWFTFASIALITGFLVGRRERTP
ncbi:MAG: SURF1 family protein [Actinomycetota bacterium]